ncbi:MAG: alpha,alpha-trehalose-phosphate synthase (UDP-forming) [Janthinobacterium lividum]
MNRLVVVSNRVPAPSAAGAQAGGLAVALESLMERRGGVWFGWSGRIVDAPSNQAKMIDSGQVQFATLDLSAEEHDRYYNEFSNSTLWPLLHSMPEMMTFDRRNALAYRAVNERFVEGLRPMLRADDLIWIHDYHLMAMPALLRARGVLAPIGFFLHIPFPSADMLASVPESEALVRDLLACDLIGFQTANDVENFAEAATRHGDATRLDAGRLQVGRRQVRLGVFPVEIEAQEFAAMAEDSWLAAPTERLRRSLSGQRLILGVDRMDPTKGLPQRLAGYRRLLETRPEWHRRTTFLQIAAESRKDVVAYQDLRNAVEQAVGAINSAYSEADWVPVRLVARAGARSTMAGYMREARVGLVTPLRDGMNLVAKEFIAAQDPQDPGVLILSRFAGAARQLGSALIVNPHDPDQLADALDTALNMSLAERQMRWQESWNALRGTSALAWGRSFVAALLRSAAIGPGSVRRAANGGGVAGVQSFVLGTDTVGVRLN